MTILLDIVVLVKYFFTFSTLSISTHSLLASKVSGEKLIDSLSEDSLLEMNLLGSSLNLCLSLGYCLQCLCKFYCRWGWFQMLKTNKQTRCCLFKLPGSCFSLFFSYVWLFLVSCSVLFIRNSIHLLYPHTRSIVF